MIRFTPRPLYPWERATDAPWKGRWVSPQSLTRRLKKRKICCPLWLKLWSFEFLHHARQARLGVLEESAALPTGCWSNWRKEIYQLRTTWTKFSLSEVRGNTFRRERYPLWRI